MNKSLYSVSKGAYGADTYIYTTNYNIVLLYVHWKHSEGNDFA